MACRCIGRRSLKDPSPVSCAGNTTTMPWETEAPMPKPQPAPILDPHSLAACPSPPPGLPLLLSTLDEAPAKALTMIPSLLPSSAPTIVAWVRGYRCYSWTREGDHRDNQSFNPQLQIPTI
ncbi:hypothetical protein CPLU01_08854 [Colletotrichum plurivorum]|uniref:Uncharacterized protein n=1 Tax=Colletotrichum plurivorum TaxID=2175906 RepID=A0A8H6KB18_9PEZI|nr:hypothetical protein CPLU01_08854 [Colletotrichum plurivorum]